MIDNLDELILLLLRTSGMHDAVLTYEEETGVNHAEATTAVRELARKGQPGVSSRLRVRVQAVAEAAKAFGDTRSGRNSWRVPLP